MDGWNLKESFLWCCMRSTGGSCCSWSRSNAFFETRLQFLTSNAILRRKLFLTAEFLVSPRATMQTGPAHWLPFHQGGGGVRWGRGECRTEWQVVGEPWESHWLTAWKLNTGLWFCLTAGVSLLPLGQGLILLTKLVPLTLPVPVSHGFFLAPAKS